MLPYFGRSFMRMNLLSNALRRELMYNFNRKIPAFDVVDYYQDPRVSDNVSYQMRFEVNDNGNIKIKTVSKEPGKEWNVKVEEYCENKTQQKDSLEQKKSDKNPEAIEQTKIDNMKVNSNTSETTKNEQENVKKDNMKNTPEAETKETTKQENKQEQKPEKSEQSREVSRRQESSFDEIQSIFNSIERDFEDSLRRSFGYFEDRFPPRHQEQMERRHLTRRYESPFAEMDAIFDSMEREFDYVFGRQFGVYAPFYRRVPLDQMKENGEKETSSKEERNKPSTPKKEEASQPSS